ncbi:MAG TPA: glycosyltransferase [Thermoanaerobaculia bacterium]|nr:glycosyltransferase [Thermoanaerobaculia bacterium]
MTDALAYGLIAAYYAVLLPLALFGVHRLGLLLLLRRAERARAGACADRPATGEWPAVTVQLPLYNEPRVAPRLLEAVSRLAYPRDRLEIQVLDDSTDDTTASLEEQVARLRGEGIDVRLLHRAHREGYKAGALAAGLRLARGELLAVFDADFVPPPDFLRRTVPRFADPAIGMVQARWGHLNRRWSLLTRVQALLLDGHFLVEHAARAGSGRLFNFNGTAGVWRRQAILDAGGWQHDTLTEDLDLSYRAQLAGWRFAFLPEVLAPAELPVELHAFRGQQRRWTRGSAQCLRKLLAPVLRSRLRPTVTAEALVHLSSNLTYPLMVALTVLLFPAMWLRQRLGGWTLVAIDLPILLAATGSVVAFYLAAGRRAGLGRWPTLALQPPLMALGIGMAWHNTRAALGGLLRSGGVFERTPKHCVADGDDPAGRRPPAHAAAARPPIGETALALYLLVATTLAIAEGVWLSLPFVLLFLAGYLWIVSLGWLPLARRAEPLASRPLDVPSA